MDERSSHADKSTLAKADQHWAEDYYGQIMAYWQNMAAGIKPVNLSNLIQSEWRFKICSGFKFWFQYTVSKNQILQTNRVNETEISAMGENEYASDHNGDCSTPTPRKLRCVQQHAQFRKQKLIAANALSNSYVVLFATGRQVRHRQVPAIEKRSSDSGPTEPPPRAIWTSFLQPNNGNYILFHENTVEIRTDKWNFQSDAF